MVSGYEIGRPVKLLLKHLFGLEQVAAVNDYRGFQQGYILPGRVVFR